MAEGAAGGSVAAAVGQQRATGDNPNGCHLSGVLVRSTAEPLADGHVREYTATLTTRTRVRGNMDSSLKGIAYSIGKRQDGNVLRDLALMGDKVPNCPMVLSAPHAADVASQFSRISNLQRGLIHYSMLKPMYRLGQSLALYSNSRELSCAAIRGGANINVRSVQVVADAIPNSSVVFIPRTISQVRNDAVFCALAAAVNACGSGVLTDHIAVHLVTGAAMYREYDGEVLVNGVVEAIRVLLNMARESGEGPAMALALAAGMHCHNTVIAHTDEGGMMRDVLRRINYERPYGAVCGLGVAAYNGLPGYRPDSYAEVVSLVDSILLGTAALVAQCDPLVMKDGQSFPEVFAVPKGYSVAGADDEVGENNMNVLAQQVSARKTPFVTKYARALGVYFHVEGDIKAASIALEIGFESLCGEPTRHLNHASITPWYWIEPTSLLFAPIEREATEHGYGLLVPRNGERMMPLFEKVTMAGSSPAGYAAAVRMRSARTSGAMIHLLGRQKDGLAHVVPTQCVQEEFVQRGKAPSGLPASAGVLARHDMSNYLWRHWSCHVPAPGECNYARNADIGITVVDGEYDAEVNMWTATDVFSSEEMAENVDVHLRVSAPMAMANKKVGQHALHVCRNYAVGVRALHLAGQYVGSQYGINQMAFAPTNTDPWIPNSQPPDALEVAVAEGLGHTVTVGAMRQARGPALEPVTLMTPMRRTRPQPGGGANRRLAEPAQGAREGAGRRAGAAMMPQAVEEGQAVDANVHAQGAPDEGRLVEGHDAGIAGIDADDRAPDGGARPAQ